MARYWWICVLLLAAAVVNGCDTTDPTSSEPPPPHEEPPPDPTPAPPPNIILIMADDLGYETIGADGGSSYQTPRLDALARTGMRFTQAYSTPKCTTTRVQLMTGKYNFRNYIGFGLLDPSERTFAHLLHDAGYRTAVVGKWQLFGTDAQRHAVGRDGSMPDEAGFDEYALWQINETGSRYKDPVLYINSRTPAVHTGAYGPDVFADYIEDFLERNQDQPFFLYYPMLFTHKPHEPTPDHPDYHLADPDTASSIYFPANVAYMDKIIGRIVDKLDLLGLRQNTLILFTGDNGTAKSITSIWNGQPIQGGKGETTSAGTHVPLIANWPGTIPAGRVNDNLVDFTDFLPTLMEAAQAPIPQSFVTDGLSFYPQLLEQADTVRSWIFCHYDPHPEKSNEIRYVQSAEWKLYENGPLFHVSEDPEELSPVPEGTLSEEMFQYKQELLDVLIHLR